MDGAFDRFLDWFDKLKWAILGTLILHLLLIGFLAIWQIRTQPFPEDRKELAVQVIDDETMEELLKLQEELRQIRESGPIHNVTNDMSAEQVRRLMDNDHRRMSNAATEEMVEEELRKLEEEEFQRLAEERTARGEDVEMPELDPSKWNPENYMPPTKRVRITGRTTTSYFLEGRGASIPTPAYICEGAGTIRINVRVDRSGVVRSMETDSSSSADQCIVDAAMDFVSRSRFEPSNSAPNSQRGWIEFTFVAQ